MKNVKQTIQSEMDMVIAAAEAQLTEQYKEQAKTINHFKNMIEGMSRMVDRLSDECSKHDTEYDTDPSWSDLLLGESKAQTAHREFMSKYLTS